MYKKLKSQLALCKEFLDDANFNYDNESFRRDWKAFQDCIENAYYLGLISDTTYENCKNELIKYIHLFQKSC